MNTLLVVIVIVAVIAVVYSVTKITPPGSEGWLTTSKGDMGEELVAKRLSKLPEAEYKIINNLLINHKGKTTQIDHVVVSEYRIFIIETKNYQGRIYGGVNSEQWTQNIYGKKYKFWNPIRQNQGHIRVLSHIVTDIHPDLFISIVTFSRRATLDIQNSENVVYWDELCNVILSYQSKWISTEQAQKAYQLLLASNTNSIDNKIRHVQDVKQRMKQWNQTVAEGKCPNCGGKLVTRDGKYGKFYGCSNYPLCRFTHKLS